jgi:hypothetical protein
VVGNDRIINLFGKGFKFDPKKTNHVKIMIDSKVIGKSAKVMQDGNVRFQLKVSEELLYGLHFAKIVQKVNRRVISAGGRFVIAAIDDIGEDVERSGLK